MNSPQRERFLRSLRDAKAYRRELLSQLTDKIEKEDKINTDDIATNYGYLGDIELDVDYLEKLLHLEDK